MPLLTCLKNALRLFVHNKSVMNGDHEFALVVLTQEANWVGHTHTHTHTQHAHIHNMHTYTCVEKFLASINRLYCTLHSSVTSTVTQLWCVRPSMSWRQFKRNLTLSVSNSILILHLYQIDRLAVHCTFRHLFYRYSITLFHNVRRDRRVYALKKAVTTSVLQLRELPTSHSTRVSSPLPSLCCEGHPHIHQVKQHASVQRRPCCE